MKRRNFIKLSSTSSAMALMPFEINASLKSLSALECDDVSNRKIVLINLAGGNDGLNTTVPLNQYDLYSNLRPNIRVPESGSFPYIVLDSSLPANQQIGLNPGLQGFKKLYDQGWLRVLQSVGYPSQNKSHFKSTDLYVTGNDGNSNFNGNESGWMGRFMEKYYSNKIGESYPLAIQVGSTKTSLGFHGEFEHGMSINLTGQDAENYYSILDGLGGQAPDNIPENTDYGKELKFIVDADTLSNQYAQSISSAFNSGSNAVTYPDTDIANQLKTVARLISGNMESKLFMVRISGFDTHNNQTLETNNPIGTHLYLLYFLSQAIEAFFNDLNSQSLADDVVGVTYSEFGRKAKENGNLGTDHGEIAPVFVFGKPVNGGVSGINPDLTEATNTNNYQIKTFQFDYRQTFGTLLQDFLGADNSVIDSSFFNHTENKSFVNDKVSELIRESSKVDEDCFSSIMGVVNYDLTPDESKLWQIYPNPCVDMMYLTGVEEAKEIQIHILTLSGSVIYSKSFSNFYSNRIDLTLTNLKTGAYLIQIRTDKKTELHKFLKI